MSVIRANMQYTVLRTSENSGIAVLYLQHRVCELGRFIEFSPLFSLRTQFILVEDRKQYQINALLYNRINTSLNSGYSSAHSKALFTLSDQIPFHTRPPRCFAR